MTGAECGPVTWPVLAGLSYDPSPREDVTVSEQDWLAERFEENRRRLRAVAYRMLGSVERGRRRRPGGLAAAQPVRTPATIENLAGWLTTVVARVCLDMLARARRAARGAARSRTCPTRSSTPRRRSRSRARGAARRLGRARAARRPRDARAGRAARVRAARHVRRAVRRDRRRSSSRSPGRRPAAGEPRPPPRPRRPPSPTPTAARQREVVDAFLAAAREGDFDALVARARPRQGLQRPGPSRLR